MKVSAFLLLCILLIPLFYVASATQTARSLPNESESALLELIEANQILKRTRNNSDYVAAGTVVGAISKLGENGEIRTYADISVVIPLKGNIIKPDEILTVWYEGGEAENLKLVVTYLWFLEPGDTVVLPSIFELKVGMNILFFTYQRSDNVELLLYMPLQSITIDHSISSDDADAIILQETQPSTTVAESNGYGFGWGGLHRNWDNFPVLYNIDPDGTADIAGTDEFPPIRAAFQTWEDDRFSGLDFTDNGTGVHEHINTIGIPNGKNVMTWLTRTPDPSYGARTYAYALISDPTHIIESDTEFNDNYDWSVGAVPNRYDVQSTATHEIGHFLYLLDLTTTANQDQTMYFQQNPNDIKLRSLEWGDLNGAHYVYPVHNDAGSGGDGSNTFADAGQIAKNIWYYARLCDLPTPDHTLDTQDWYKFYTGASARLAFTLFNPPNADFDLELYNPSGALTDYSRRRQNGGSETIARDPMGTTGWWRLRIVRFSTGGQGGNGVYQFKYQNIPLALQP